MGVGPARFPNPCICKICSKGVPYTERKRCPKCGEWIHNFCGNETGAGNTRRTLCFDCLPPCSSLELIDSLMREIDSNWEPESYKSGVIYLASIHHGPNEQKIVEMTGYTPEEVQLRGDRLRENKLWRDDGKVALPGPISDEDPRAANMSILLAVLCADGLIQRSDAEESAGSEGSAADAGAERAADTDAEA